MRRLIDLTGQKFGYLTAVRVVGSDKWKQKVWECLCDCGEVKRVASGHLRSARTRSCGCRAKFGVKVHGHSKNSPYVSEYNSWRHALDRTVNPKNEAWANYGGRGITMSAEWAGDFTAFLRDMGPKPSPKHSVERRDNDGPYAAGNCYWATRAEQSLNNRNNMLVTYKGETKPLSVWVTELGIPRARTWRRLKREWPVDVAFEAAAWEIKRGTYL